MDWGPSLGKNLLDFRGLCPYQDDLGQFFQKWSAPECPNEWVKSYLSNVQKGSVSFSKVFSLQPTISCKRKHCLFKSLNIDAFNLVVVHTQNWVSWCETADFGQKQIWWGSFWRGMSYCEKESDLSNMIVIVRLWRLWSPYYKVARERSEWVSWKNRVFQAFSEK